METGPIQPPNPRIKWPEFGQRTNTRTKKFDFEKEVEWLLFKLYIVMQANMRWEKQNHFTNMICDNPEVFSLHDQNLGYCYCIKHTIPSIVDRSVYVPHCTIPSNCMVKFYNCLDTLFCQGIIHPPQSPYSSQVMDMCKKFVYAVTTAS